MLLFDSILFLIATDVSTLYYYYVCMVLKSGGGGLGSELKRRQQGGYGQELGAEAPQDVPSEEVAGWLPTNLQWITSQPSAQEGNTRHYLLSSSSDPYSTRRIK